VVPLEALKAEFYGAAGWDETTGIPTRATLERLGISDELSMLLAKGAASQHPLAIDDEEMAASAEP
jgi:hypothetical protein